MSRRRQLIVNADDLGYTIGINDGIFEAHDRGLVTSATLMVGFPAAEDAAQRLSQYPELGIGLHVALTGGRPVLPASDVPSLVDAEGRLPRRPDGLGNALTDDLRREIAAQLECFLALTARRPTHLDSHHHSHRLPNVLDAMVTVANAHKLPVRRSSPDIAARLHSEGLATTDRFDETFFGDDATTANLLQILADLPPGTTELMCHPAHVDDTLRARSTYVDARVTELEALTSFAARQAIEQHGIRLVHFGSLGAD